ncbi:MAG: histidine kinase [Clostridium sp.]|uniref:sensor histidine kinase n=1 Tax=Clostridium sp. TaxID=1506 RepID=UPI002907CAFC|nr:histidine kinase [Clostridium sp.]MDU5109943.1 histidine kinase [Clostridium sp.]
MKIDIDSLKNDLRLRMMIIIFISFTLFMLLILSIFYGKIDRSVRESGINDGIQMTEQLDLSINEYIRDMKVLSGLVYSNIDIEDIIFNDNNKYLNTSDKRIMNKFFSEISIIREDVLGIAFSLDKKPAIHNESPIFRDTLYNNIYDFDFDFWNDIFESSSVDDMMVIDTITEENYYDNYFIVGRSLKDFYSQEVEGYILFFIRKNGLERVIDTDGLKEEREVFLIDINGQVIYGDESRYIDDIVKNDNKNVLEKESGHFFIGNKLVSFKTSESTGAKVVSIFKFDKLIKGKEILNKTVWISIATAVLLSIMIAITISRIFSYGIKEIIEKLNRVSNGEKEVSFRSNNRDEIAKISNSIEDMLIMINNYRIKEIKAEQRANEIILRNKDAEFYALQNQINPHFLYNTLDSIRMKALINKDVEVSEMVNTLSKLFRMTIKKTDAIVSFKHEIDHVKEYLQIHKYRMRDRINWRFSFDDNLLSQKVPKFILQPIVENSITHGINHINENGLIEIKAYILEEKIIIEVNDNGIGIDEEKVIEINSIINSDFNSFSENEKSIGLANINKRIKLLYGDKYGISINSKLAVGTGVKITLAIYNEGEEEC